MPAVVDARVELIDLFEQTVPNHSHSVGMISLFLKLVLRCAVGFRGAAAVLKVVSPLFPVLEPAPSPNGGQFWLLRLGLFELTRIKERADDWIWFIDHTIQIGNVKCLIVVGVRLSAWLGKRDKDGNLCPLTQEDLSIWLILPVSESNGEIVLKQLEDLSEKTQTIPAGIVSDCGADLQKGIADFCEKHTETVPLNDIAHAVANVLKAELNKCESWAAFMADANRAKTQMRQTKFAFLMPPELKPKARWMNLEALVTWSGKALDFVTAPHAVDGVTWEPEELEAKLGWLLKYRSQLSDWSRMMAAAETTLQYVRQNGYHLNATAELRIELEPFFTEEPTAASRVAYNILEAVQKRTSAIPEGKRLPGSSEVLESLIGKAKQLEGQQSKSGFTKMVLGIAAAVADLSEENIKEALAAVPVSKLLEWIKDKLGHSIQAQRYQAFTAPASGTKPG
ncbi:MAG: hypothetical protein ACKV0T_17290 [Planctomycetales bacterium]